MGTALEHKKVGRKPGTAVDSPELRESFLETLRQTGNVGVAAEIINVYRTTPYQWKKKDPAFAKRWEEALDAAADVAEAEVRRRAVEGWDEPVFYKGEVVGYTKKYSDRMLELHIKALKPEKYRDKQVGDGAILIQINGVDELKALRESSPWGGDKSVQVEGQGEPSFKTISVEVEDISNLRSGHNIEAGRANMGNVGLTEAEKHD